MRKQQKQRNDGIVIGTGTGKLLENFHAKRRWKAFVYLMGK